MLLKLKFMLPVAILTGFLATFGSYRYIQKQSKPIEAPKMDLQKVVVAKTQLVLGTKLKPCDLSILDWPVNIVPKGCFSSIAELEERVVMTDVNEGEAILDSRLAPVGSGGGFSSIIPTGMRAITVTVNTASGVGGFILPNTRVDVFVTVPSFEDKEKSTTKIILENIKVLAIDQSFEREDDDPTLVQSVTLLVTPEQGEKLVLASTEGKLQLGLRNSVDHLSNSTSGVALKELISKPKPTRIIRGTASRKKPKPLSRVVEVIRSNERTEISFNDNQ